jgi:hypothetical protein
VNGTVQDFSPTPRPAGLRKMANKNCYRNALITAQDHGLAYAEGRALTRFGWIPHAWNVDVDGNAIDRTWKEPGTRYVGYIIPTGEALGLTLTRGTWGPVLTGVPDRETSDSPDKVSNS